MVRRQLRADIRLSFYAVEQRFGKWPGSDSTANYFQQFDGV